MMDAVYPREGGGGGGECILGVRDCGSSSFERDQEGCRKFCQSRRYKCSRILARYFGCERFYKGYVGGKDCGIVRLKEDVEGVEELSENMHAQNFAWFGYGG